MERRKMKVRVPIAIAIVALTAAAFHYFVIIPFRCDHVKRSVEALIRRFAGSGQPPMVMVARLRAARDQVYACIEHMPHDLDLRLEAAACDRFLGRPDDAIEQYQLALKIDRRPEIYLNLATTLFEQGRREEATDTFATMMSFATFMVNYDESLPWSSERVIDLVPPELQAEVAEKAERKREAAKNRR